MDMMKMIKEAARMRSRLSEVDKSLRQNIFEVEDNGIRIKLNAKSEILDLSISEDVLKKDVKRIEKDILSVLQKSLKKAQDTMQQEAKKLTGGMNIPGLS